MDPRHLFADERHSGICVYCGCAFEAEGSAAKTRDHVPGKVFLDEPYPHGLPVVDACDSCNGGMSADEQYLACLLECIVCETLDLSQLERRSIAATLRDHPSLYQRIANSRSRGADGAWIPDRERVDLVVLRLAQGHVAHEFAEPALNKPCALEWSPLSQLPGPRAAAFSEVPAPTVWPEIGSRAFLRAATEWPVGALDWVVVQPRRYSYLVHLGGHVTVRILLRDYLACEVTW